MRFFFLSVWFKRDYDILTEMDILVSSRSESIIVKHGSANVTKGPKLCVEIRPRRLFKCHFSTLRIKRLQLQFIKTKLSR